jgi:hypothetical protein
VAVDGAGNVLLTGDFDGTVDFGGGPLTSAGSDDIFVAKLDAQGNHLWSKRFGDSYYQQADAVTVDGARNEGCVLSEPVRSGCEASRYALAESVCISVRGTPSSSSWLC